MYAFLKTILTLAAAMVCAQASAQITFYQDDGFAGRSFTTTGSLRDLNRYGFNDRASSVVVERNNWQVCEDAEFGGRCVVLQPGRYPSLSGMGLNDRISSVREMAQAAPVAPAPTGARVTFYEREDFQGQSFTTTDAVPNFTRFGFNDRAASIVVERNNWQVCEDAGFGGRCAILQPGRYPSLSGFGMAERISSVREVPPTAPVAPAPAGVRVTFYEREDFQGQSFTTTDAVPNFSHFGFNDRAASMVVERGSWQACEDAGFGGRCVVLQPGRYASLSGLGMTERISSVRTVAQNPAAPAPSAARVTFYEREDFRGRSFTTVEPINNVTRAGFNDRASSIVVERDSWQVCEDISFGGRCVVLREGRYPSLTAMGMGDRISSLRQVDAYAQRGADGRFGPVPGAATDYSRRGGEQLFEANVIEARAVLATPQQRCWVERGQVPAATRGDANVPGAIAGALLGGVIGHQIGGGFGKDLATLGGVAAGAAVGANVGRDGQPAAAQDVQRCADVPGGARPAYWDVTYRFQGVDHRMQMSQQPGATVTVNSRGEPRN